MDLVTDGSGIVPFSNEHIIALGESSSSKKGLMEANPGKLDVLDNSFISLDNVLNI